jgi:hypothetical protein
MILIAFLITRRNFLSLREIQHYNALQAICSSFNDVDGVHEKLQLVAFHFEFFAHCHWKFFGRFSCGSELGGLLNSVLELNRRKLGQSFHRWIVRVPESHSLDNGSGAREIVRTMTNPDEMKAELERLRAENAALKKTSSKGLSLKVSEKGGVSLYGLGRFPVTLYKEQWLKLLGMTDEISAFIQSNDHLLKAKE